MFFDSIYMKYPEQINSEKQKQNSVYQGLEGGGREVGSN